MKYVFSCKLSEQLSVLLAVAFSITVALLSRGGGEIRKRTFQKTCFFKRGTSAIEEFSYIVSVTSLVAMSPMG